MKIQSLQIEIANPYKVVHVARFGNEVHFYYFPQGEIYSKLLTTVDLSDQSSNVAQAAGRVAANLSAFDSVQLIEETLRLFNDFA